MDPNATLAAIREMTSEVNRIAYLDEGTVPTSLAAGLSDAIQDLDEWMSKGGFPPVAWDPDVTRRT